jgi:hypothetical protein
MNLDKYKWKYRILLIHVDSYKNEKYLNIKDIYQEYIKEFHKRHVKLLTNRKKDNKFNIQIIGFDGKVKKNYKKININRIFKLIDSMPMAKQEQDIKAKNLSLFSDYNPKTTIKGLGFKNKEKALYTIDRIKNEPIKYQVSVVTTMIGRAKNHPHKTDDMDDAIKIFNKWIENYKKKKN